MPVVLFLTRISFSCRASAHGRGSTVEESNEIVRGSSVAQIKSYTARQIIYRPFGWLIRKKKLLTDLCEREILFELKIYDRLPLSHIHS